MKTVTPERMEILKLLKENGEMRTGEIADCLNKRSSSISNLIEHLMMSLWIINTKYGYYDISKSGEVIIAQDIGVKKLANY